MLQTTRTVLIGAGGVGAFIAQHLRMIAETLYIVDGDEYEPRNETRQPFAKESSGVNKAIALVEAFGGRPGTIGAVCPIPDFVTEDNVQEILNITNPTLVILAVDKDEPRKLFFEGDYEFPIMWAANERWDPQAGIITPRWKWNPMKFFAPAEEAEVQCGEQTIQANAAAAALAMLLLHVHLHAEDSEDDSMPVFKARLQSSDFEVCGKELKPMSGADPLKAHI